MYVSITDQEAVPVDAATYPSDWIVVLSSRAFKKGTLTQVSYSYTMPFKYSPLAGAVGPAACLSFASRIRMASFGSR